MAKKNYPNRMMSPAVTVSPGPSLTVVSDLTTGLRTCQSCGHYHDEEEDARVGLHGECRLNPPHCAGDHLTRRGAIRRYALVLAATPSCGGYRPR